jgi:hypothetical protein
MADDEGFDGEVFYCNVFQLGLTVNCLVRNLEQAMSTGKSFKSCQARFCVAKAKANVMTLLMKPPRPGDLGDARYKETKSILHDLHAHDVAIFFSTKDVPTMDDVCRLYSIFASYLEQVRCMEDDRNAED